MKLKKNIIGWCIFIISITGLGILLKQCITSLSGFYKASDVSDSEFNLRKNIEHKLYSTLFKSEYRNKLKFWDAKIGKKKHAYLSYTYDRNHHIIIYQVNLKNNIPLDKLIIDDNNLDDSYTNDKLYKGYESYIMHFQCSPEGDSIVNNIYLKCDKNPKNKIYLNDSILVYNYFGKKLSFRYKKNAPIDFILTYLPSGQQMDEEINLNVTFYKKNKSVFIIILYPSERNEVLDSLVVAKQL